MALFGSIFKGRAEKKEEPKESPAPAAPVTAPPPQVAAPSPRKTAAGIPPPPREKPMQLEEIVAALQQIETLMAEPSVASPSDDSGSSDRLQTVAMSLRDIAEVVPSSFIDTKFTSGEKADVVIEDLFGQMAKGKIETTLGYLLAGVSRQHLANPAELKSEMKVSLPLAAVVAAVDPVELKKRTGNLRQDRIASELPNLFNVSPSAVPAKTDAAPPAPAAAAAKPSAPAAKSAESVTLNLKIAELKAVMPSTFKSAAIPPDAKVDVVVDDVFAQLAKGSVKVPMNQLLAAVPKPYLSAGAEKDSEDLVTLPLAMVVAAIPPDELKKRTAEVSTQAAIRDLPDLFKRTEPAPAAPKPEAPPAPKVEPKATPVPEAKPVPQPQAEAKTEQPVRAKLDLKPTAKPEAKEEPKPAVQAAPKAEPTPAPAVSKPAPAPVAPIAPAPKIAAPAPAISKPAAAPIAPAPKPAAPAPAVSKPAPAPIAPAPKPAAPAAPPVEAPVAFAGPAPKKFMPMDLVAGGAAAPAPVAQPPAAKVEKPAPVDAPIHAPVSLSGIPVLLLRGLDLNQASAEELTRVIDGIGDAIAHRIVENRKEHGPFFGLYDLGRVPGIGEKIYEKITGQPWLEEKYGQLPLVDELLGRWTGKHPQLKDVAEKFKKIPGFDGCIIIHRDGDLLATSWQVESPERLQAMAPQILKNVKHYMRHISSSETYSVTVFHEGFSFTFVESEDICFVAVHNPKGLSRRHIQIVNSLGVALGRRFSGYRGA